MVLFGSAKLMSVHRTVILFKHIHYCVAKSSFHRLDVNKHNILLYSASNGNTPLTAPM